MTLDGDTGLAWALACGCGGGDDRCAGEEEATFVAGLALTSFLFPPYPPDDDPTGLPRGGGAAAAGAVDAPPLALFSNAAARAEALGPLEAPMIAAALPVAELVPGAGAVEEDAGRW